MTSHRRDIGSPGAELEPPGGPILGIEGTAHTCGVGIVRIAGTHEGGPGAWRCDVLANQAHMHRPEDGGIHPRVAAEHHVEWLPKLVRAALDEAGLGIDSLGGIAFSQGPGLGPCLRTVATAARALALRHDLPLVGVNHCVAHLEIGRAMSEDPTSDPVFLYASGGNTQIIAEGRGRYRVFGETLDIGIGNALDKFARDQGIPFPGGPEIEVLAAEGEAMLKDKGDALPELPYSVKGMDVAFSGIVTAANALVQGGSPLPVVCHALQEWTFAMLVEVTERAVAHTQKEAVVLGGGVGRNQRLQAMLRAMAVDRGASFAVPEGPLLSDNGAMIAWNGLLALAAGGAAPPAATVVNQTYRTDQVPLTWRAVEPKAVAPIITDGPRRGAEALVEPAEMLGQAVMVKRRLPKGYRHPRIEERITDLRVRREAKALHAALCAGIVAPRLCDLDAAEGVLVMERVAGPTLKEALWAPDGPDAASLQRASTALGVLVRQLHGSGRVHGDLTSSNVILVDGAVPVLVDFGLSEAADQAEAFAVDLHVFEESLHATHEGAAMVWEAFLEGYRGRPGAEVGPGSSADGVLARLEALAAQGRYRSMLG